MVLKIGNTKSIFPHLFYFILRFISDEWNEDKGTWIQLHLCKLEWQNACKPL